MKISNSPRKRATNILRIFTLVSILAGLWAISSAPPQLTKAQGTPNPAQQAGTASPSPVTRQLSAEELRQRTDWRISMAQLALPGNGCFQAAYPNRQWTEVTCTTPPNVPIQPQHGPRPLVIGNRNDISAQAPTGFISTGIGTFDSITGVTSVSSPTGTGGSPVTNAYGLQLNTNTFSSPACSGSPNPGCQGWEQFAFLNNGSSGFVFIQYWLIRYNTTCPSGWNTFQFPTSTDIYCYRNNTQAVGTPNEPITNLAQLSLSGSVTSTGDSVSFSDGSTVYARNGNNFVGAAAGWQIAEFNVFGYCCGGQAVFNSAAAAVPRTRIFYGGNAAPGCFAQGFTGETSNLSFGPTAPGSSPPGPAVFFSESWAGGATSNCMAATSIGDTHLTTLNGLFYDFQASGDFILAQAEPNFVVQTRQVSGAPTWPDATVNKAVATQMGKSKVAICLPDRLIVDGKNTEVADGQPFSTSEGVDIWRTGNTYVVTDQNGNSLRAELNPTWINVFVGLGRWPTTVTGLLTNADNDVNKIAARDGTVFTNAFSFRDLYQRYGESWRVAPNESLLAACGDRSVEQGNPGRPFFAKDLDRSIYDRTRAVCIAAGVKGDALLDACTLDVAVIGNDAAAKVFVNLPQPVAAGNVVSESGLRGSRYSLWLLLLIILILLLIWWLFRRRRRTTP